MSTSDSKHATSRIAWDGQVRRSAERGGGARCVRHGALRSQTGDVPIDNGAVGNKGEASMVREVLSHAGLRKVVEGIIAEQFAGRDKIVIVSPMC